MKKVSFLSIILLATMVAISISCTPKEQTSQRSEQLVNAVRGSTDAWEKQDAKAIAAMYAQNATRTGPRKGTLKGKRAIETYIAQVYKEYPDFTLALKHVKVVDNETFAVYYGKGTNTGDLEAGISATGKAIHFDIMVHSVWDDAGKIIKEDVYYDRLQLLKQLGFQILPPTTQTVSE